MKIRSESIVTTFKPIRVSIDLESQRDMDVIRGILDLAKKHAFAGTEQMEMIERLIPSFTRL